MVQLAQVVQVSHLGWYEQNIFTLYTYSPCPFFHSTNFSLGPLFHLVRSFTQHFFQSTPFFHSAYFFIRPTFSYGPLSLSKLFQSAPHFHFLTQPPFFTRSSFHSVHSFTQPTFFHSALITNLTTTLITILITTLITILITSLIIILAPDKSQNILDQPGMAPPCTTWYQVAPHGTN